MKLEPFTVNEEIVDEICDRLASGESMASITKDERMPSQCRVYIHMAKDEAFRHRINIAREAQQEFLIDQTIEMADSATPEDVQVVKLRIWARQWRAGKLASRKYGDKIQHGGAADLPPIQTETRLDVSGLTDEQLRALSSIPLNAG